MKNDAELLFDDNQTYLVMNGKKYPELSKTDLVPETGYVLHPCGDISTMNGINQLLVGIKYADVKAWKSVSRVFCPRSANDFHSAKTDESTLIGG